MRKTQSKEFTKVAKTLEVPFKTPEFANDGIATIWQGMKDKALQMATFHQEQASVLKAGTITELTRLREDIKKHLKDIDKEGVQGSKKVGKRMDKFVNSPLSLSPHKHPALGFRFSFALIGRVTRPNPWGNGFLLQRQIPRVSTMITIHMFFTDKFAINYTVQWTKKINSTNNSFHYRRDVNTMKPSLSKQFKKPSETTLNKSARNHNTPSPSPMKPMVTLRLPLYSTTPPHSCVSGRFFVHS